MPKSSGNPLPPIPYDEVVMLHDHPYPQSTPDELFNITLAENLGSLISTTGVKVSCRSFCEASLQELASRKSRSENFVVFNLVENVERKPEWQPRAMQALEDLGVAFTGTDAKTLLACDADKFRMKEALIHHGLPTPIWATRNYTKPLYEQEGPWLVKSALYHGSFNIHQSSISNDPTYLLTLMQEYEDAHGGLWFAEQFVNGREFYIGLIGQRGAPPELLPEAEIIYNPEVFNAGRHALLTESGKWDESGEEFKAIQARFGGLAPQDPLAITLRTLSSQCWMALNMSGYARVDFRTDHSGQPYILEINTNPYLGIDDSYIFQPAASMGMSVIDVLIKIILCAHPSRP
ncbi:MAG: hypothetical protein NDJ24_01565 [Alphaproteobacteria bacterium]|nr:hypothetical protein [Alphaproteobacteria bacterium]